MAALDWLNAKPQVNKRLEAAKLIILIRQLRFKQAQKVSGPKAVDRDESNDV